jgi:hypothetical protein
MKTSEKHSKRTRRTAVRKADRYRREAAFFKQRNATLIGDLRRTNDRYVSDITEADRLLSKTSEELASEIVTLRNLVLWVKSQWLCRVVIWALGRKDYFEIKTQLLKH